MHFSVQYFIVVTSLCVEICGNCVNCSHSFSLLKTVLRLDFLILYYFYLFLGSEGDSGMNLTPTMSIDRRKFYTEWKGRRVGRPLPSSDTTTAKINK